MTRTQVQLSHTQIDSLQRQSAQLKVSVSELVRRAVDAFIGEERDPNCERRARAADVAGKFSSGRRDTSEHHDGALADAFRAQ